MYSALLCYTITIVRSYLIVTVDIIIRLYAELVRNWYVEGELEFIG